MSRCLVCKVKTTRVAKEKAGRYTLCDACVANGYHINKKYGCWCVTNVNDSRYLYSCHELLTAKPSGIGIPKPRR